MITFNYNRNCMLDFHGLPIFRTTPIKDKFDMRYDMGDMKFLNTFQSEKLKKFGHLEDLDVDSIQLR
jgi:hypothetical protein